METLRFRSATPADADGLADVVGEGFETYRPFAPEGWEPPDRLELALGLVMRLSDPLWWCVVADEPGGGAIAGHVALMPASQHREAVDDPTLAHLLQLFVRPPFWGSGLASRLHAAAVAEAAARGFVAMRLFTPAGQGRARRFYEREGWDLVRGPFAEDQLGLEIVEYRRGVTPRAPGGSGSRASA